MNPRKTILQPVARGIDFVGHVVKPWHRITRRKTVHTALTRLQDIPAADLQQSANSYFGLLRQATHSHHDRTRIASLLLQRGRVVKGDFTKTYATKNS
jgi:RNA-directed DNA polymerase